MLLQFGYITATCTRRVKISWKSLSDKAELILWIGSVRPPLSGKTKLVQCIGSAETSLSDKAELVGDLLQSFQ